MKEAREARHQANSAAAQFPHLQFDYTQPEPNFDRRRVFGPVAKLIQFKDLKYATALEVAAGPKVCMNQLYFNGSGCCALFPGFELDAFLHKLFAVEQFCCFISPNFVDCFPSVGEIILSCIGSEMWGMFQWLLTAVRQKDIVFCFAGN